MRESRGAGGWRDSTGGREGQEEREEGQRRGGRDRRQTEQV